MACDLTTFYDASCVRSQLRAWGYTGRASIRSFMCIATGRMFFSVDLEEVLSPQIQAHLAQNTAQTNILLNE